MGADVGPIGAQGLHLNVGGFGQVHSRGALLRRRTVRWTFDIQHRPALGQQRRKLLSLNLAYLFMVATDRKYRNLRSLPELMEIVRFMVQHHPANIHSYRGESHLRKRCSARGLVYDGIRTRSGRALNEMQHLLALGDRVVVGMDDLKVHSQTSRNFFRSCSLFLLIVVIVVGERDQKAEFFHTVTQPDDMTTPKKALVTRVTMRWMLVERGTQKGRLISLSASRG